MDEGLDPALAAQVRASFARQGLMRLIGAEMLQLGPGSCTIRLPFCAAVGQQSGFFHGVCAAIQQTLVRVAAPA